ncbi:MAG: hypothetical protein KAV82_05550 [Phycisphaerae bacterium]|nr:hypothetical protein [Phycisphaerae bacterium]
MRVLGIASMVVLMCTALCVAGPGKSAVVDSPQTMVNDDALEVVTVENLDDFVVVTNEEEMIGAGFDPIPIDPNPQLACVMSYPDNYIRFQTIAKGKRSAFGWCGDPPAGPPWEMCAELYPPPPLICKIPACPAFESVIRNECMWEDFWAAHYFYNNSTPPDINFDNYVVIAVVLGERNQCSYQVNIASIQLTDCGLVVRITECTRLHSTPFRVNPYHFVKIPKACLPCGRRICFDHGKILTPIEVEAIYP